MPVFVADPGGVDSLHTDLLELVWDRIEIPFEIIKQRLRRLGDIMNSANMVKPEKAIVYPVRCQVPDPVIDDQKVSGIFVRPGVARLRDLDVERLMVPLIVRVVRHKPLVLESVGVNCFIDDEVLGGIAEQLGAIIGRLVLEVLIRPQVGPEFAPVQRPPAPVIDIE